VGEDEVGDLLENAFGSRKHLSVVEAQDGEAALAQKVFPGPVALLLGGFTVDCPVQLYH